MKSSVFFARCKNYNKDEIKSAVGRAISHFGGISKFVKPNNKVLLKINLVAGHAPVKRVNTDPAVVKAVAELVLDCGGQPVIADSPGIENFNRAAERSGIAEIARELKIPCVELTDPVELNFRDKAHDFKKIEVARLAAEADVIINLPKLKTHSQMLLTLGVKNMFGCVVGRAKAAWHYNVGLNRDKFASLLIDIYQGLAPALTIIDGVVGMQGDGPTGGSPYEYNLIGAAEDALSMDFWLCKFMGVNLDNFALWRAAKNKNLAQCDLSNSVLAGDFDENYKFQDLKIPAVRTLRLLPKLPFIERAMTSRPVHIPELCVGCGRCQAVCAAGALVHNDKKLKFDYKKCIRCYCCQEMCPVHAIKLHDGLLLKIAKFL